MTEPRRSPGRLRTRREFDRVFREGAKARDPLLKVAVARSPTGEIRLGTAVSRRIGGAVARNRVRRRLKEAFRRALDGLPPGIDVVVVPLRQETEPPFARLEASLRRQVRRAFDRLPASPAPAPPEAAPRSGAPSAPAPAPPEARQSGGAPQPAPRPEEARQCGASTAPAPAPPEARHGGAPS